MAVLLGGLLAEVPVGTPLALVWLLGALLSGRLLRSRGAVLPALADLGLPADAGRRARAALPYGSWTVQALLRSWPTRGQQEGRGHAHVYAGFRPVVGDVVGCLRPRLNGGGGKPDQSGATKALPALVLAVGAAVGAGGKGRVPGLRRRLRVAPGHGSAAARQRRAIPPAGATVHPAAVLVVDAGFGGADLLPSRGPAEKGVRHGACAQGRTGASAAEGAPHTRLGKLSGL